MDIGYIKLYRKLKDNPISGNIELLGLFTYLLLEVNHSESEFYHGNRKIKLNPGEKLLSQRGLAEKFGISISKIHRFIKILEDEKILKHEGNSSYTIIKLLNWDKYNGCETQTETKQKPNRNQIETNNNDNNVNNEKNDNIEIQVSKNFETLTKELIIGDLDFINSLLGKYNETEENIKNELRKFYLYWSEKNISGKKEKWQMEKTFDIQRRFYKWLDNSKKWANGNKKEFTGYESI